MKNYIVLMMIFISFITASSLIAQQPCLDVVQPTNYRVSITDCCIKDIKEGNIVVYTKKGLTNEIEAVAINLNGEYFELNNQNDSSLRNLILQRDPEWKYMGKDYEYYQLELNKANSRIIAGSVLIPLGIGLFIGGGSIIARKTTEWPDTNDNGAGILLFLSGAAGIAVGIPLVASGASKKHKIKLKMDEIKRSKDLSLKTGPEGVTLVLNF